MGETFARKILGRAAGHAVTEGDEVRVAPDLVLTGGDTGEVLGVFTDASPGSDVLHPDRLLVVLDGDFPPVVAEAIDQKAIRSFAAARGISRFFEPGSGSCNQVLSESAHVFPGSIIAGTDRRTCTYGAFNCYAFTVGAAGAAMIWKEGSADVRVPATIDIRLSGGFRERVGAKDLALAIMGSAVDSGGKAVEFHGSAISGLRMYERMTLSAMGAELGAVVSVFPADGLTEGFFCSHEVCRNALWSDSDAVFDGVAAFDLDSIPPMTALPGPDHIVVPVRDLPHEPVDVVYLGTCVNGRTEDIEAAVAVMKGRKVAPGVRFIVCPASRQVYLKALRNGLLEELVVAGAVVLPPGGGLFRGRCVPAPGERCLSTAGIDGPGTTGESGAEIYIAGPETAAATAVTGIITDPREV